MCWTHRLRDPARGVHASRRTFGAPQHEGAWDPVRFSCFEMSASKPGLPGLDIRDANLGNSRDLLQAAQHEGAAVAHACNPL